MTITTTATPGSTTGAMSITRSILMIPTTTTRTGGRSAISTYRMILSWQDWTTWMITATGTTSLLMVIAGARAWSEAGHPIETGTGATITRWVYPGSRMNAGAGLHITMADGSSSTADGIGFRARS